MLVPAIRRALHTHTHTPHSQASHIFHELTILCKSRAHACTLALCARCLDALNASRKFIQSKCNVRACVVLFMCHASRGTRENTHTPQASNTYRINSHCSDSLACMNHSAGFTTSLGAAQNFNQRINAEKRIGRLIHTFQKSSDLI